MPNNDHDAGPEREDDRERSRQRVEDSALAIAARQEIEDLHAFFVGWFSGQLANDDDTFQRGFARRFDPGFLLIPPAGTLLPLAKLSQSIRAGYGTNPDFRIQIRNVTLRREIGKTAVLTYEEWQRSAKASTPADNGRVATVLMTPDRVAPGGFSWLHLHECWLPRELMDADPFDF